MQVLTLELLEASTQYLLFPGTAERIRHRIPEARLIVALRHPAERIYSSYLLQRMTGREPCGKFEDALQAGRHLMKGKYATLLAPFYENFRRERIHVSLFDDLVSRPMDTVKSIYTFLGVDASFNSSAPTIRPARPRSICCRAGLDAGWAWEP